MYFMETMALRIVSLSAMKVYNYVSMVRAEVLVLKTIIVSRSHEGGAHMVC